MTLFVEYTAWVIHRARIETAEKESRRRRPACCQRDHFDRGRTRAGRARASRKEQEWRFAS
jgi:hypothetical protein